MARTLKTDHSRHSLNTIVSLNGCRLRAMFNYLHGKYIFLDQSTVLLNLNKVFIMKANQQLDFKEGNVAASLSTSFATLDW